MDDRMIMFTHDGLTFMYRVGGIAIHDGRVLVEQAVGKGFCFLPGGRVEFGEAIAALLRGARRAGRGFSSPPASSSSTAVGGQSLFPGRSSTRLAILDRDGMFEGPSPTSCSSGSR